MTKTVLPQPASANTQPPQVLLSPEERDKVLRRAAQTADQRVALKADDPEAALVEPADSQVMTDPPHPAPSSLAEKAAAPEPKSAAAGKKEDKAQGTATEAPSTEAARIEAAGIESADSVVMTDPPSAQVGDSDSSTSVDTAMDNTVEDEAAPAPISVHRKVTLASTRRRLLAGFVDLLIVVFVCSIYLAVAISRLPEGVGPAKGVGFDRLIDAMWVYHQATIPAALVFFLILILFQFIFVYLLGQTPGLMLMHLHIMSSQQRGLGAMPALKRAVMMAIGLLLLGLGWAWVFWDGQRRCWHDLVAKTLVGNALDEVATLLPQAADAST